MSREIKIGLLTLLVLITFIWGYTFLKGRNLLTTSTELYTTYTDVTDLNVSSPVLVNGYKIGTVTKIKLNPNDVKKMDVYYIISTEYKIPKNAKAVLKSLGFVSGKGIFIEFEKVCSGADCVVSGDQISGDNLGLLGAMLGSDNITEYSTELTKSVNAIIGNIGKEGEPGSINETIRQLEQISKNINSITASTNTLINNSSANLDKTIASMASITSNFANNNKKIESMLANLDKITADISKANMGTTLTKTNETLDESKIAIAQLKNTLTTTNSTMEELSKTLIKINKGDGSLGKLMNDKELYNNLASSTKNLDLLLQDLRLNPKRYAHFSLFGKKQNAYTLPDEDPANKLIPEGNQQ